MFMLMFKFRIFLLMSLLLSLFVIGLGARWDNELAQAPIKLVSPNGLALDEHDNLYISDIGTNRIVRWSKSGKLESVAGTGSAGFSGDGKAASLAQLNSPHDLIFDKEGNMLIADSGNHRIRRIDKRGIITTIAGDGKALQSNYNGAVPETSLNYPQGIALDNNGSLLIADTFNHVIRRLDANFRMSIIAGSVAGFGGDGGPATSAQLSLPMAVVLASDNALFISDAGNSRIRQVLPSGIISTIAGYGPAADTYGAGYVGDNIEAIKAKIYSATDLKIDKEKLLIVDSGNHRIRIISDGMIRVFAGSGHQGFAGDGKTATNAKLNTPQKVLITRNGELLIADRANSKIRKVDRQGIITTLIGTASNPQ